jgi:hypothetical protein
MELLGGNALLLQALAIDEHRLPSAAGGGGEERPSGGEGRSGGGAESGGVAAGGGFGLELKIPIEQFPAQGSQLG